MNFAHFCVFCCCCCVLDSVFCLSIRLFGLSYCCFCVKKTTKHFSFRKSISNIFKTIFSVGFLVDKFGKYKPVVIMSLLLNAIFHHSLMLIPQQEIPGQVPNAYVMKHPVTGSVEVCLERIYPLFKFIETFSI